MAKKEINVDHVKLEAQQRELESIKKISEQEIKEYHKALAYSVEQMTPYLKNLKMGENTIDEIAAILNSCNDTFSKIVDSEDKVHKVETEIEDLDSGIDAEENSTEATEDEGTTDETTENTEEEPVADENNEQTNYQKAEKQEESFHNFLSNSACRFLKD